MPPKSRRSGWRMWRALRDNPVVLKELRGRMRGARAFVILAVYLGLLGAFTTLMYVAVVESSTSASGQTNVGEIGRTLFGAIVGIELLLVSFIAPAFTAGAISSEREHQTFDLLRTTLLPNTSLVLGKLLSSMLYVVLLLLAAIPLQSIAFFFGGVAETEVLLSFLLLSLTALLFSAIGLFFSASAERTLSASVLTYVVTAVITFGVPVIVAAVMLMLGESFDTLSSSGVQAVLFYVFGAALTINPAATALITQYLLVNQRTLGVFDYTMANGEKLTAISPWIPFSVFYLVLTVVFIVLSVRRLRRIDD